MRRRTLLASPLLLAPAVAPGLAGRPLAQEAAPPAVTVAAGGLVNPRGVAWDASGALLVAEAGNGAGPAVPPDAPGIVRAGLTARVSRVEAGCPAPVAERLPSITLPTGEVLGAADVATVDGRLVALVSGGGSSNAHDDAPAGLYELAGGAATPLVDLGYWAVENPVADRWNLVDAGAEGDWRAIVPDPAGGAVWAVDRSGAQVVRATLDGEVTRVVDLSATRAGATALALGPDGALHVALFGPPSGEAVYAPGSASVLKVDPDGTTEPVWTGLTMVSGLAFGPDGTLHAAELSAARDRPPAFVAATGRVLRQTGPDTAEELLTQLNFPTAVRFGPDGALYVSLPAFGADGGTGVVLRADLAGAALPLQGQTFDLTPPACTPAARDDAFAVSIFDFGFDPSVLAIPAGSTVRWVNAGATDHTVTAFVDGADPAFDSGVLAPGADFSHTFPDAGSLPYACALHPDMTGAVDVVPSGP